MIPVNLRAVVYKAVARNVTDDAAFESMFTLYRATDQHEEKARLLSAMASVKQRHLIERVLDFAMTDEVRRQDLSYVMGGAVSSRIGRELVWTFLQQKKDAILKHHSGGSLARMVRLEFKIGVGNSSHASTPGQSGSTRLLVRGKGSRGGVVLCDERVAGNRARCAAGRRVHTSEGGMAFA